MALSPALQIQISARTRQQLQMLARTRPLCRACLIRTVLATRLTRLLTKLTSWLLVLSASPPRLLP